MSATPEGLQVSDFKSGSLEDAGMTLYFAKDGDLYPSLVDAFPDFEPIPSTKLHGKGLTVHTITVY